MTEEKDFLLQWQSEAFQKLLDQSRYLGQIESWRQETETVLQRNVMDITQNLGVSEQEALEWLRTEVVKSPPSRP